MGIRDTVDQAGFWRKSQRNIWKKIGWNRFWGLEKKLWEDQVERKEDLQEPALEQEQPEAVLEAKALEIVALEIADLKITVLIPPVFPGINRPPDLAHPLERHLRCRRLPVWITARETGSAI